jgi:hypothetical protein
VRQAKREVYAELQAARSNAESDNATGRHWSVRYSALLAAATAIVGALIGVGGTLYVQRDQEVHAAEAEERALRSVAYTDTMLLQAA